MRYADRIERFAALNAPHPAVWCEAMRNNPAQRRKSRYVRFFAIPYLPELLRQGNFQVLAGSFKDAIRPDAFTQNDLCRYRAAWSQPGAIASMINWYRALLRKQTPPSNQLRVGVPTLIIWAPKTSLQSVNLPMPAPGVATTLVSPISSVRLTGSSMTSRSISAICCWNFSSCKDRCISPTREASSDATAKGLSRGQVEGRSTASISVIADAASGRPSKHAEIVEASSFSRSRAGIWQLRRCVRDLGSTVSIGPGARTDPLVVRHPGGAASLIPRACVRRVATPSAV